MAQCTASDLGGICLLGRRQDRTGCAAVGAHVQVHADEAREPVRPFAAPPALPTPCSFPPLASATMTDRRRLGGPGPTPAALLGLGTATLGESGASIMAPRISASWPGAVVAAPACTVRCAPGDNLAVHAALAGAARPGTVLVVDVGGVPARGYFGEILAAAAWARGVVGVVIDGGVRDTAALIARRFPVFSVCVALRGASKDRAGTVGRPVTVGDVAVRPGDWIVGDADGVVVVPEAALATVMGAARDRAEQEARYVAALQEGRSTVDLLNLDPSPVEIATLGPLGG